MAKREMRRGILDERLFIRAMGFDVYNQTLTGEISKALTCAATDSDHVPCVLIETRKENENAYNNLDTDEQPRRG